MIPGRDSDDVGDPEDLSPNIMGEAEQLTTDFEGRVLATMPTRQEIHQLSQESQIPEDKIYEEERKKAETVVLALEEMDEAFPALPDGIMDVEMPAAAVTEETTPTTSSPPPAAPSFADRVSTSSSFFRGKTTLSASIGDLKDFSVETFAADCHNLNAKAWNGVTGIQVISSRKILEIAFANTESMASLQLNGLNTHGRHVVFQPDSPQVTCVTFWNIPLEMPSKDVDVVLQKYGTIKHSFRSRKMLQTRNVHTGARVYFFELKSPVPRSLTIGGKHVKSKYTGQQTHIAEDRADKERVRSEQKEQLAEQTALRRAEEEARAQALAAAAEEERELAKMSRQHPDCYFGPEIDRPSVPIPLELIAQAITRGSIQVVNKTTDLDDQGNVNPDVAFQKVGGKRVKNHTKSDNEEEVSNKKVLVSRPYDIDLRVIAELSAVNALDLLPEQAFEQGDDAKFSREKLEGILCYRERGSLLDQPWFTDEYPFPDPEKYCKSVGVLEYWKIISGLGDDEAHEILQAWISHFNDYKLYV